MSFSKKIPQWVKHLTTSALTATIMVILSIVLLLKESYDAVMNPEPWSTITFVNNDSPKIETITITVDSAFGFTSVEKVWHSSSDTLTIPYSLDRDASVVVRMETPEGIPYDYSLPYVTKGDSDVIHITPILLDSLKSLTSSKE